MHPSLEMFILCENMKWAHLPTAGGIHAQHPRFIEDSQYIFQQKNAAEARENAKTEAQMNNRRKSMNRSSSRW